MTTTATTDNNKSNRGLTILLWLLATLLVLSLIAYAAFTLYLPRVIANGIKENTVYTQFLPKKAQAVLNQLRPAVQRSIKQLAKNTKKSGISYQELMTLLDEIEADDIELAITELSTTQLKNKNQAFDIIKKNINITSFDIEKLRQPFLHSASLTEIKKTLKQAQAVDLINEPRIKLVIETGKQVLSNHQHEFQ